MKNLSPFILLIILLTTFSCVPADDLEKKQAKDIISEMDQDETNDQIEKKWRTGK